MLALCADIGSTFTKLAVFDLEADALVCTSQAPTTIEQDVTIGLREALRLVERSVPELDSRLGHRVACSSAAGGLRMVTVGLVPDLTVEAAKRAALGAGAKVVGVFSHELTTRDVQELVDLRPDVLLLTGGTNGGNKQVIIHNAGRIAASPLQCPVVVAGNRVAVDRVEELLREGQAEVWVTENVMPEIGELNIRPAQETIRDIFLQKIIEAKGVKKLERFFSGVLMPTPSAVLRAADLLSQGTPEESGWGDLMVVDVGGATTDVISVGKGEPSRSGVVEKGLPEPVSKRTVEGDMGIRYNAPTILEVAGLERVRAAVGRDLPDFEELVCTLSTDVCQLPGARFGDEIDIGLARTSVEIATGRHAGSLETVYTPVGELDVQYGKDLTAFKYLIGTGGVFAHGASPRTILEGALFDRADPMCLRPTNPEMLIDEQYIMAAVGLLSDSFPTAALRILKKYLRAV